MRTLSDRSSRLARLRPALLVGLLAAGLAGAAGAADEATEQLRFGVQMAQRGLWNEAVFRFERALTKRPDDPKLLNDLAVAYEAVGRFDDASATYKRAVAAAPGNGKVKKNYSRFLEFLQNYRLAKPAPDAPPAGGEGEAKPPAPTPPPGDPAPPR
jgi:Flp pilus assembly protein TadD